VQLQYAVAAFVDPRSHYVDNAAVDDVLYENRHWQMLSQITLSCTATLRADKQRKNKLGKAHTQS